MIWARVAAVLGCVSMLYALYWSIDDNGYERGRAEVQAAWDMDKSIRKAAADIQAQETATANKEHSDALAKTKTDLSDTRRRLAYALERLRNAPAMPGQAGLPVAGGGQGAVSGVADHSGGFGIRVPSRIGGCEDSGADPCTVSREFFEQALMVAIDRRATRHWAAGQGIKAVE